MLELDTNAAGDVRFKETFEEIKNAGFRKFAQAESAVLPMWKGMKYTALGSKTYNADTTRDIRAMIDDVTDFTARAYGIPPVLLSGSVQNVD
ncbi:MAG: phage portal protein, partial [Oscillospiraceae bacterium]|nr:phage portal protein [Oscillospiraceae bacterium]